MAIQRAPEHFFCHCCGREVQRDRYVPTWCGDCRHHIIDGDLLRPAERTYEAQNGARCPFTPVEEIPAEEEPIEDIA